MLIGVVFIQLFLAGIFGGLHAAQRNIRNGRGDTRGARRRGFRVAVVLGVAWLVDEYADFRIDINDFLWMLIVAGALGGLT